MSDSENTTYQVLARKYRPETFQDLVGQDAMVRTLKNAFAADRIAHAFVMTGIRGTGKTTTARIIAKGMNCIGPDGTGGPTTDPCGKCEHCVSIMEGRHVDVMEMDAASRTGVGDIREIIESVHYAATSARFKIYIIDEVHMLSTSAFNALLKTLEEPPEHVKFIFATTEIRKIPVTVLSRCQRFDLRRIEPEDMISLMRKIATAENAEIAEDALALIVRSAEGSARDATSLLDQAIAHGAGETTADQVRAMLGLADRGRVLDLFDMVMRGQADAALNELSSQYADGADPLSVLRDLAEITHWVSVIKISPEAADDPTVSPDERERGRAMGADLPMRALTRMWQMLLKAIEETSNAPNAMMAAEMALIRLTHVAELPSPEEIIRKLQNTPQPPAPNGGGGGAPAPSGGGNGTAVSGSNLGPIGGGSGPTALISGGAGAATALANAEPEAQELSRFARFEHVVELIRARRDMKLLTDVENYVRIAKYTPGRIEFQPTNDAPSDLTSRLAQRLQTWTGARWGVTLVNDGGGATIAEQTAEARDDLHAQVAAHPLVVKTLAKFPGADIRDVRTLEQMAIGETILEAVEEIDDPDDWDPFEEG
ncbi:DNA polymerase III subunit gamma/tau [Amylibacter marinus]|uniref:DNA polymerase III subunit gamma/tau n=1 Tax=Amylibacter marinus TaxID=1475483 RepID=A0ABQ5VYP6_9RHOB|nr:DNA polymerase III subunit gamma/tau [Amylibacter marinus]GLQ36367.1 DNA polymerase III subunit gamma/tau [Amylibacter marinus]